MIKFFWAILQKDILLSFRRHGHLLQAILLGLLLIFIFSLSRETGAVFSPVEASTVFWISSIFCTVLTFNQLYGLEEENGVRVLLALSPLPLQSIWLAKMTCGLFFLLVSQLFFFLASIIFLDQYPPFPSFFILISFFTCDLGLCALGSLLGALCHGQSARDSLFSILFFPLLTPLIISAIKLGGRAFGSPENNDTYFWLQISFAFTFIFLACGLVLSGIIYRAYHQ